MGIWKVYKVYLELIDRNLTEERKKFSSVPTIDEIEISKNYQKKFNKEHNIK